MRLKVVLFSFIIGLAFVFIAAEQYSDDLFLTYKVDIKKQNLGLFWKDDKGNRFGSIENFKLWASEKNLKVDFVMNAGMYKTDHSPQGLYIEKQKVLSPLDTAAAEGNFYLKPNGVFFITTKKTALICTTERFKNNKEIEFATQSGPMLVIDGQIHSAFKEGSKNLNIRNGVGILPNGNIVFVLSKKSIFMILPIILKVWDVKMLCILMDLYRALIFLLKNGFKPMEILVRYLQLQKISRKVVI